MCCQQSNCPEAFEASFGATRPRIAQASGVYPAGRNTPCIGWKISRGIPRSSLGGAEMFRSRSDDESCFVCTLLLFANLSIRFVTSRTLG